MKIMFIVYHDIHTEARTQEILKCAQMLGETYFVSFSRPLNDKKSVSLLTGSGSRNYRSFIIDSIKYIKRINPDIIILHDNYTAVILSWLLLKRKKNFIIYDSSELYIDIKIRMLSDYKMKFLQFFENKFLKYADVTIAANLERANIMKEHFKLKELPIVFDNIHKIDEEYNEVDCLKKYREYFTEGKFNVLYAGGISKGRMTYKLAEAVGTLGKNFTLLVVGNATSEEKKIFEKFNLINGFTNVKYLGFVSRVELKFLLDNSHVSVSAFRRDSLNNIYCASGKAYESLFQGTPILTTENPPLVRLCEEHGIGVATDNFTEGLIQLYSNYEYYCKNVQNYILKSNYEKRIELLKEELEKKIKKERF